MRAGAGRAAIYDRKAPRRPVNLSLNEDLVLRARELTRNLSGTVEELLAAYLEQEQARKRAEKLEQVITALNDYYDKHGFLSDEFPSF